MTGVVGLGGPFPGPSGHLHQATLGCIATPLSAGQAVPGAEPWLCAQRESFDVIGKVGFGQDFQASKDIDNPVNTFRLMTDNMEEGIRRIFYPLRKYSRSKVRPARGCGFRVLDQCARQ